MNTRTLAKPLRAALLSFSISLCGAFVALAQPNPEASEKLRAAVAFEQKGDLKAAEEAFEKFTKDYPNLGVGWFRLAHVRHAQGRYEESVKGHLKAAEFSSFRPIALFNTACAYAKLNQTDQAFETLQKAVEAGFADRDQIASDSDLEILRSDPRFDKLLPPILTGSDVFAEPTRVIYTLDGEAAGDEFGWVARKIGDIDKDGVIDFASTAPGHANHTGKIYVYSGKLGKLLFSQVGKTPGERFGSSIAGAGDVNVDGIPDCIVGAPQAAAGLARILSGVDGKILHEIAGSSAGAKFGQSVAPMGDLNGDGLGDFVATAIEDGGSTKGKGECIAFSGSDGSRIFTLSGAAAGDQFGSGVGTYFDNKQKLLAVGAMEAGAGKRGRVYLYRIEGSDPILLHQFEAEQTGQNLGQFFLCFPGDVDADGTPDLFCTDFSDSSTGPGAGRVYVYSSASGKRLLDLKGARPGEGLGTSVSDAGDVNGDGIGDLVIGAWQNNEKARSGGKIYLYSGKGGALLRTWTCKQSGDTLGFDAQGIGDVDGDGAIDFLVTSAWSNVKGAKTGRVFVLAGEKYPAAKSRDCLCAMLFGTPMSMWPAARLITCVSRRQTPQTAHSCARFPGR